MKKVVFILCWFLIFSSCNNEKSNATNKSKTDKTVTEHSSSKIEDFDCASFFKKGNYSSLCFIDSTLPKYIGSGCIFDFETKGDKQEEKLLLQFVPKGSAMLAQMHFNLKKDNYKKGTITAVSNLGDAAFFDVHGTDLKSMSRSNKDLHVCYKNIAFTIKSEYKSNTEMPCFFNDKELIAFAKKIIGNL